ncbi:uncharacterized protein LOC118754604 [Rhagoletis pomonella]|uniref:uncharacterized protein LOC118754604 n=1 Tax=Rhagoletis pomonella TaxID=28610 RepID=UPI0017852D0D|nr:uncharacterized protein LOC118754604 [Rhagoletis pomonella]
MYMNERLHGQAYNIVRNPPNKDKYETLRQAILNKFSVSPITRLEQLISGIQLGDRKSSHMLTQLQRTGVTTDKQLIKDCWLQKLPVSARAVITGIDKANTDITLEELESIADEIMDVVRANSTNAVTVRSEQEQTTPTTKLNGNSSMETGMSRIERALARIKLSNRRRRSSRPRSHSRTGETGHSSEGMPQKNCWYHRRFGDKA